MTTKDDSRARTQQETFHTQWKDCIKKISYSDRYSDDQYDYRHVILQKNMLKLIYKVYKAYFADDDSGCLRLLSEEEWRSLGITQSPGWVHYEVHAPEPHVLLFRRERDIEPPMHQPHGRAAHMQ